MSEKEDDRSMTMIQVSLPDELAQRAESEGLLSDEAIRELLEDAMRRIAGGRLLEVARRIREVGVPPMSDEEIMAEVRAVRAERRVRLSESAARGGNASGS